MQPTAFCAFTRVHDYEFHTYRPICSPHTIGTISNYEFIYVIA